MTPVIFHIDVNSAYLSWTAIEQLNQGGKTDLRLVPSIIGGDQKSRHGVVLAKSVPAKKYGIHTGEPVADAFRKCPNLISAPPDHQMYQEKSQALMDYLRTWSPEIEQMSVDECFMDFTGMTPPGTSPEESAYRMKDEIREKFGYTVNIGISNNKVLAKMASDFEKPDKVHTLYPEEIEQKMWPLPVERLYMAGKSSVSVLHKLEIRTIGELAKSDPEVLASHLKSHGRMLWEYANGIDDSPVQSEQTDAKGIGNSVTLSEDIDSFEEAKKVLTRLSGKVAKRLADSGQKAGMVSVEIKYADFQKASHQEQLEKASNEAKVLSETSIHLFREMWNQEPIRLLGVRTAKLSEETEPEQLSLFDMEEPKPMDEKHRKALEMAKEIQKKYGGSAVMKAADLADQPPDQD